MCLPYCCLTCEHRWREALTWLSRSLVWVKLGSSKFVGLQKNLAQSQNLRSISDRSPNLVFGRFCFSESWTSHRKRNNIRWTSCCRWNSNQKQEVWYPAKTYVSSTKENKMAMAGVWWGKGRKVLRNVSQKISIVSRQVLRLVHIANVYWARANSQALG